MIESRTVPSSKSKTVMLQVELFSPPRRAAAARKDAPFFVACNTPVPDKPASRGSAERTPHRPARPVPPMAEPAVSAVPAPHKLDIPRLLGP